MRNAAELRRRTLVCFLAAVFASSGAGATDGPGPSRVSVDGRLLIVERRQPNGDLTPPERYAIRGVAWSPASRATVGDLASRRQAFVDWATIDLPAMAALGVNTVRLFLDPGLGADGLAVLDELYARGIMAVVTVDEGSRNLERTRQVVEAYKSHPSILFWSIGSEWNINFYFGNPECATPEAAAHCTEAAARLVRSLDPLHPVATSYGDIHIDDAGRRLADTERYVNEIVTSVDIWGINAYRGSDFGELFSQWRSISGKPMFIGEFGTDALIWPERLLDEALQAHWNLCLWNDLAAELSSLHPELPSVGGTAFEWNDEWWKVDPAGSQQNGGFFFSGAHPDDFANEEYFGLVDIDRRERLAAGLLPEAYSPSYRPPPNGLVFGAGSRGASAAQYSGQLGYARFYRCGKTFYNKRGGGNGGRGFNAVVLDPATGTVIAPPTNFDTYITRGRCATNDPTAEMFKLIQYLQDAPAGSLVLLAVADEAGLTRDNSCTPYSTSSCFAAGLGALEGLGSQRIRDYCFRDSWALIAVKGAGAVAEGLAAGDVVALRAGLPDPGSFGLQVDKAGSGTGRVVTTPDGVDCPAGCPGENATYPTATLVALSVSPSSGSWFAGWSGDSDCHDGLVWLDRQRSCVATFEAGCGPESLLLRHHVVRQAERHQACDSITARDGFRVAGSASLDLVSGRRVVLGDGFSVGSGGALRVSIDPALTAAH